MSFQTNIIPVTLSWENIEYSVRLPRGKGRRHILKNLSGSANSGELIAIVGPSGSGKTSLLNTLAGRVPLSKGAQLSGRVMINGRPVKEMCKHMADISAYVEQDDSLFALSSVFETLMFAARLRLPQTLTREQLEARVNDVIAELGLVNAKFTLIGNERIRGVSGGERRRVNIGVDLLDNPPLVFLDEPTSGLDSFQAAQLVNTLKLMARAGRTVLTSLHQPRSSIYAQLDTILVMTGGEFAYAGPAGHPASEFFAMAGYPVPEDFNPADHFIDSISISHRSEEELAKTTARVEDIVRTFNQQRDKVGLKTLVPHTAKESSIPIRKGNSAGTFKTFLLLLRRAWREQTRDKATLIIKFMFNVFFSVMFGLVYLRMDNTQASLQNRTGILFFMAMNQAFGSSIGTSQVIPQQLKVVSKERASKLYNIVPYYLSCMLVNLPLEMVPQIAFGAIVYFMVNLRGGADHFFIYMFTMILENFVGISLGMVLSASFTSVEMAPQIAPAVVVLFLMFSGYFLNEGSIPVFLTWLKYLSFIRYAFQALCVNEFEDVSFKCDETQCLQGNDWLRYLNFDDVEIYLNIIYLGAIVIGFNLLALLILISRKPKYQRLIEPSEARVSGSIVTP